MPPTMDEPSMPSSFSFSMVVTSSSAGARRYLIASHRLSRSCSHWALTAVVKEWWWAVMRRRATEAVFASLLSFVETVLRGTEWPGRRSVSVWEDAYTLYAKNARQGTRLLAGTWVESVSAAVGGCCSNVFLPCCALWCRE
jgi:hypothetical protein